MSYGYRWLGLVAITVLAACAGEPFPLAEVIAGLEGAGYYEVEYQLTTFFEGTAKPVMASGYAQFEGSGKWRVTQDSVVTEYGDQKVRVKVGDTWQVEEIVELPIHPLPYLKGAGDVRQMGRDEGNRTFSFSLDRERYRQALAQVLGEVPPPLDELVARFSGNGEVTLDVHGRPVSMRVRLQDSSTVQAKTRQELELKFVELIGDHYSLADSRDPGFQSEVRKDGR